MTTRFWLVAYLASLVGSILVGTRVVYGIIPPYNRLLKAVQVAVMAPFLSIAPGFVVVASVILFVSGIRRASPRLLLVALVMGAAGFILGSLRIASVATGAHY
jgi:hypothetical protein